MIAIKINTNFVNYSVIIFPQTYEINIVLIFIENFRNTKTATINATEQKKKIINHAYNYDTCFLCFVWHDMSIYR